LFSEFILGTISIVFGFKNNSRANPAIPLTALLSRLAESFQSFSTRQSSTWPDKSEMPHRKWGISDLLSRFSGYFAVHRAEHVPDCGTEKAHHGDHNYGHECEDDRILNKALPFFLGCEKHNEFLSKICLPEGRPQTLTNFTHSIY